MRWTAFATDYDGTLTDTGVVAPEVVDALERLGAAGCRRVLVTGRELGNLASVFPAVQRFDRVVGENGGVLHTPATGATELLGTPAPRALVISLAAAGVTPLSVGRVIVATREPYADTVREALDRLGLAHQVSLNKGAVMVLPAGVAKATGLAAALRELELDPRDTVGVGDAENDADFLAACGCGVAVANAIPALRARADLVTRGADGAGVIELIERMLADDLPPPRHD